VRIPDRYGFWQEIEKEAYQHEADRTDRRTGSSRKTDLEGEFIVVTPAR
jgi:hypothetical protein